MKNNEKLLKTGFESLDNALGGGLTTGVTLFTGVPGICKTSLSLNIAMNVVENILKEKEIVAIDLETTGLNEKTSDIIEVGAVKIKNGQIIDKFTRFIRIDKPLSPEVIKLTGIQDKHLMMAQGQQEVLTELLEFCGDAEIAGHNTEFDYRFLKYHGAKFNLKFKRPTIDTMELFTHQIENKTKRYSLSKLAYFFKIKLETHEVLNDAMAVAEIIIKLSKLKKENSIYLGAFWVIDDNVVFDKELISFSIKFQIANNYYSYEQFELLHPNSPRRLFNYYPFTSVSHNISENKIRILLTQSIDDKYIKIFLQQSGLIEYEYSIELLEKLKRD